MSESMPSCGRCRYFGVPPTDPNATAGICRRHAPTVDGWPGTKVSSWCGDWMDITPLATAAPIDAVLDRVQAIAHHLGEIDERLAAVEYSVTAAHIEITRKEL